MHDTTITLEMDCTGAVAISDALATVAPTWTVTITPTARAYACRVTVPGDWSEAALLRCIVGALAARVEAQHQSDFGGGSFAAAGAEATERWRS